MGKNTFFSWIITVAVYISYVNTESSIGKMLQILLASFHHLIEKFEKVES